MRIWPYVYQPGNRCPLSDQTDDAMIRIWSYLSAWQIYDQCHQVENRWPDCGQSFTTLIRYDQLLITCHHPGDPGHSVTFLLTHSVSKGHCRFVSPIQQLRI